MVRDVEAPVEQRPPAGARHGQLVDGGVGVTLGLQRRLGDRVTSEKQFFQNSILIPDFLI